MDERSEFELVRQDQAGVVTRQQALRAGITDNMMQARVRAGAWQRVRSGIFWTFTGPMPRSATLWAVLLNSGRPAVLSHETAAELCGLLDTPASTIHVSVPHARRLTRMSGVVVHRRVRMPQPQSVRQPPRTTVEQTVIDLTQTVSTMDDAIGWIARACGRRLTTPARLSSAVQAHPRLRWREPLTVALADVEDGCHSLLEVRYLRDVERAHGLPTGVRQRRVRVAGRSAYSDIEYPEYGLIVELDGRVVHTGDQRRRDMRRDNWRTADGSRTLRYGWVDVDAYACRTAEQLTHAFQIAGWTGIPSRCSSRCTITAS